MQFQVGTKVTDRTNNGPLPAKLVEVDFPTNTPKTERTLSFVRNIGQPWTINGKPWMDPMSRVIAKPQLGTVEKYTFRGTGGWSHPVHLHLVVRTTRLRDGRELMGYIQDMQLLSRTVGNPNQKPGRKYLEEYEKGAIKDVALLGDNEMVTVLAKFVPYQGVYVSYSFFYYDLNFAGFELIAVDDPLSQHGARRLLYGEFSPPRTGYIFWMGTDKIRRWRRSISQHSRISATGM